MDAIRARRARDLIARAGCSSNSDCVENLQYVANREEHKGNVARALVMIRRARDLDPDDDTLLGRAAQLAAAAGLSVESLRDYEELARRQPNKPEWQRAADEQRRRALVNELRIAPN